MQKIPFELVRCSWPRPVIQQEERWLSEPEWDVPVMPYRPVPYWADINGDLCWLIDWRAFFRGGLKSCAPHICGEMRGFHIVFEIEVKYGGTLVFWDDDGSIVRHAGRIVHEDRSAHPLRRNMLAVNVGDRLEIAQWQLYGGWLWGAKVDSGLVVHDSLAIRTRYISKVTARLQRPTGPPLKIFTNGAQPLRAAMAVYSLILNGYAPSQVLLYGEHQWTPQTRKYFTQTLPFAKVVATSEVANRIRALGGYQLVDWAFRYWWVMKACVCLLCEPYEFGQIDDDVFVLESTEDALAALRGADLVYAQDTDHGDAYRRTWLGTAFSEQLLTSRFNAGLYWAKPIADPQMVALEMLRVSPTQVQSFVWEQGLIAFLYKERGFQLPTNKYFYPCFDGLPGGMLGYDYHGNPCGFTSVHFGGLNDKPTDAMCLSLVDDVLGRDMAELAMERPVLRL